MQRLRSAPPPTSELTDEEIFRLLRIVKKRSEEDWLVFRLLIEHDFKVGECVGNSSPTANLPGIQIENMSNDSIWLRRASEKNESWVWIGDELMRQLKQFAGERRTGRLFATVIKKPKRSRKYEATTAAIRNHLKEYAKEARITKSFSPEDLRGRLTGLQFRLSIFEPKIAAEANRMILFFALNYGLERTIRKLVFETLKEKYPNEWWDKVPLDVQKEVTRLQDLDRDSPKIVRSIDKLDYTTFPQLRVIIEHNWDDFKDQFPHGRTEDMSKILKDLGYERILIAHSCELPEDEKSRFEVAFGDWFRMLSNQPTN
ncbi:MAG: hypothetical protein AUF79_06160 [Crenarchaeota archaeon 13_1_20CM_2_51_8]|nr:MAG: hypothetical protein AUI97_05100 [Crenarchaeota archaeon 13_1_40CM_3_52_17]OLE91176.1 MAG: hypothetical protein AUF79_06160 [Crenarchaeota archaeon 13_1_20CM_2_51_8]